MHTITLLAVRTAAAAVAGSPHLADAEVADDLAHTIHHR
jgi:hypothetical protein